MTREEIFKMTGEQFKNASNEEKNEAFTEVLHVYNFQKNWCEKHSYMDKRTWEYRMHKEDMKAKRSKMCEWLNAIGLETIPEAA